jgi:hypothetical protein
MLFQENCHHSLLRLISLTDRVDSKQHPLDCGAGTTLAWSSPLLLRREAAFLDTA